MDRLRGLALIAFLTVNTTLWCIPLFALGLLRELVPFRAWRRLLLAPMHGIVDAWVLGNRTMLTGLGAMRLSAEGLEPLSPKGWYLVISNHQSWADILVLQCMFLGRMPVLKFFMKRELIWVPFVGLACRVLDFPFMQRYSRAYLEKHPEARGRDLETTRRACERFRLMPTSILNFAEGTRFTAAKHAAQASPYRHLLRPRAGGTGFVLGAMGDTLEHLVDVTLVYPDGEPDFWSFLCGRHRRIDAHVDVSRLPDALRAGDYAGDAAYRERVQRWITELWDAKDRRIDRMLASPADSTAAAEHA